LDRLTARQLFDDIHERMALRWVAGMRGETRVLEYGSTPARRPSLVGYLNVIYPNKIQIIGTEELATSTAWIRANAGKWSIKPPPRNP
jgi:HPr kinase/phosphorylase